MNKTQIAASITLLPIRLLPFQNWFLDYCNLVAFVIEFLEGNLFELLEGKIVKPKKVKMWLKEDNVNKKEETSRAQPLERG